MMNVEELVDTQSWVGFI